MASQFPMITLFLLFNLRGISSEIILEEGYTVTTVFDGHKPKVNPHSVIGRPGASDLLVLDSSNSLLYTLSFPLSSESEVKRLSSEAIPGRSYCDGELGQARFNGPRSFALDAKGNLYVADRGNHGNHVYPVVRKITTSGTVTTIAGGYSKATGNKDGPAQNATLSNDFELAVVADRCILLVVDRGSQSIRQIDLKQADCAASSQSGQIFGLGAVTIWTLGLVLSCLLGLFMGIILRPYIIGHGGSSLFRLSKIWKHCLINLGIQYCLISSGNQVVILFFGIKNAVADMELYAFLQKILRLCLSYMPLMLRVNSVESHTSPNNPVSLLDSVDMGNPEAEKSQTYVDQMKDLICFDGNLELPNTSESLSEQGDGNQNRGNDVPDCHGLIDGLIQANIMGLAKEAEETIALVEPVASSLGLVKRR